MRYAAIALLLLACRSVEERREDWRRSACNSLDDARESWLRICLDESTRSAAECEALAVREMERESKRNRCGRTGS